MDARMTWDPELLRRGYFVWHCYGCPFVCSTQSTAAYHLREMHDSPDVFWLPDGPEQVTVDGVPYRNVAPDSTLTADQWHVLETDRDDLSIHGRQ